MSRKADFKAFDIIDAIIIFSFYVVILWEIRNTFAKKANPVENKIVQKYEKHRINSSCLKYRIYLKCVVTKYCMY